MHHRAFLSLIFFHTRATVKQSNKHEKDVLRNEKNIKIYRPNTHDEIEFYILSSIYHPIYQNFTYNKIIFIFS